MSTKASDPRPSDELRGQLALVTGAGRGVGAATARCLAAAGAEVWLFARSASELDATVASLRRDYPAARIESRVLDVTDEAAVTALFAGLVRAPAILVNNAGHFEAATVEAWTPELSRRLLEVHVVAPQLWTREFFRRRRASGDRGNACIVNVSSLGGLPHTDKFPGMSSYVAAKFAVCGLTEAWAAEGRALGIRVNAVAPGAVRTRMLAEAAPFLKTDTGPEVVAEAIFSLCTSGSRLLSGAVVPIYSNADAEGLEP